MHDDRIAGVTFGENASCNALIVNEGYAWVGNPFSAPKQKGESLGILLFCFCMPAHGGLGTCDLKTPLPGAGGVCRDSRNRSRAARVRVPFSAPRQKGESLGILLFCFCMPAHGGLGTCDLKTPLPWAGGDVSKKWRGALVFRLRILLSGRADGQSIESSSSALPPPSFRFPFLALFLAPYFGSVVSLCEAQGRGRTLLRFCREQLFVWGCFGVSAVLGPGITPRPKIRERRCPFRRRNRSICRFRRSRC